MASNSRFSLETDRLALKQLIDQDAHDDSFVKASLDMLNDDEVTKYLFWKDVKTFDAAKNWIKDRAEEKKDGITSFWLINKDSQDIIGITGIIKCQKEDLDKEGLPSDWTHLNPYEIGYILRKDFWNQGFATGDHIHSHLTFPECAKSTTNFCLYGKGSHSWYSEVIPEDCQIVLAFTDARNTLSHRVLSKIGMESQPTKRDEERRTYFKMKE